MANKLVRSATWTLAFLACGAAVADTPDPITPEPNGVQKVRFISFVIPATTAGTNTAIRVRLASLHHPMPAPQGTPNFTMHEGTYRYVNSFSGSLVCVDSEAFGRNYRCGTLGCEPEYRDWATDLAVATNPVQPAGLIHVTGTAVVPSSTYEVSQIDESCGTGPDADACTEASAALWVSTSRWADVAGSGGGPPDGIQNVIDCGSVVDTTKGVPTSVPERRAWLKNPPNASAHPINVIDCGLVLDSVKNFPYPYSITECN